MREALSDDEKKRQSDDAKDRGYLHAVSRIRCAPWDSCTSSRITTAPATTKNKMMMAKQDSNARYQARRGSSQQEFTTAPRARAPRRENTTFMSTAGRRDTRALSTTQNPSEMYRDAGGSVYGDNDEAHSSRGKSVIGSVGGDEASVGAATEGDGVERRRQWVWDEWGTPKVSSQRDKQHTKLNNCGSVQGNANRSVKSCAVWGNSAASLSSSTVENGTTGGGDACTASPGEQATRQAFEDVQATARGMKEHLGRQRSEASTY